MQELVELYFDGIGEEKEYEESRFTSKIIWRDRTEIYEP